jgi:hypothetical protein
MSELIDRSQALESKLRDLDCNEVEISLAAARILLEEAEADDDGCDKCELALVGALAMAEAIVQQLSTRPRVYALDGDVQLGPYSYAPGKGCADLRVALMGAEREAVAQREQLLAPIVRSMIAQSQNDCLRELGVER